MLARERSLIRLRRYRRAQIIQADRANLPAPGEKKGAFGAARVRDTLSMRSGTPFIPAHDLARGLIHAVQSALHFALMLAVM